MTGIYIPRPVWGPVPVFASLPQGLRPHRALRGKTGQGENGDLDDWIPSKRGDFKKWIGIALGRTYCTIYIHIYFYYIYIYIHYILNWFDKIFEFWGVGTPRENKKTMAIAVMGWWLREQMVFTHPVELEFFPRSQRSTTPLEYCISRLVSSRLAFTVTKKGRFWCLTDGQHDQQVIVESSCNKLARSSSFLLCVTSKSVVLLNISWYHSSW